jgi:hypothetical protein
MTPPNGRDWVLESDVAGRFTLVSAKHDRRVTVSMLQTDGNGVD